MNKDDFDKFLNMNPCKGMKYNKGKSGSHVMYPEPGWLFNRSEDRLVNIKELRNDLHDNNIDEEIYYNLVLLGVDSYDNIPNKCRICGNILKYKGLNSSGYSMYCSRRCQGYGLPKESRDKISKKLTGIKQSDSTKLKRSKSLKGGKIHTEEFKKNLSERSKGPKSESTKLKLSKSLTKYFSCPEARSNKSKSMIKYCNDHPEFLDNFIRSGITSSKRGYYKPSKCDNELFYMSSWELHLIEVLDSSDKVDKIIKPFRISYDYKGLSKIYLPDLIVRMKGSDVEIIIEVKPLHFLNDDKVICKKLAAEEFCNRSNGRYKYIILTQNEIFSDDLINILVNIITSTTNQDDVHTE